MTGAILVPGRLISASFDEAKRGTVAEATELVETLDRERAAFIKKYFAKDWPNLELYHLTVSTKIGDEAVVATIIGAIPFDKR